MKIVYIGTASCSDSDFPLIRALQLQGVDVYSYFYVNKYNSSAGLFDIQLKKKNSIISASKYEGLAKYEDYINLDKVFIINHYYIFRHNWQYWFRWLMWLKFYLHVKKQKGDILHITWPLAGALRILYKLKMKIVQTIHDPFPHSGQYSSKNEEIRIEAINRADRLVLLSTPQLDSFCNYYHVNKDKVLLNRMGEFDYLNLLKSSSENNRPYVLYIGQIQEHKGIDILLEAMIQTHLIYPNVKLIVAGKGDFPFDVSKYTNLDYIEFRNYYVKVDEMVDLLTNSLFAVCPYRDATQSGVVQTAFSLEVPLIVTNVGDLPLSVQDRVTGLVVPPCDVKALSDAMNYLLGNPEQLVAYKKNIHNIWRKDQSWEPIAQKYIEEYTKLLS